VKPDSIVDGHPASLKIDLFEAMVKSIVDKLNGPIPIYSTTLVFSSPSMKEAATGILASSNHWTFSTTVRAFRCAGSLTVITRREGTHVRERIAKIAVMTKDQRINRIGRAVSDTNGHIVTAAVISPRYMFFIERVANRAQLDGGTLVPVRMWRASIMMQQTSLTPLGWSVGPPG